jgi:hypothetical protein
MKSTSFLFVFITAAMLFMAGCDENNNDSQSTNLLLLAAMSKNAGYIEFDISDGQNKKFYTADGFMNFGAGLHVGFFGSPMNGAVILVDTGLGQVELDLYENSSIYFSTDFNGTFSYIGGTIESATAFDGVLDDARTFSNGYLKSRWE